jgi:hypothetical protein
LFDAGQETGECFRRLIGPAVLRIARVQMQDRGARFSGRDGFGRNLIRRDRQIG